ncbi:MAG: type II toxin-antitoxin system PrlF family antitoxin [Planctomycetaceae bacterium]|nr:type II toxin-antitoxin system PrlF family antitoxin [Planctomycetaceae bacterium]
MSITSKLTAKNQTTIPKVIVEALQIKPSSLLMYEIEPGGRVVLTAKSATFEELAETFPAKRPRKTVTNEQLKDAVRAGAVRRFRKSR